MSGPASKATAILLALLVGGVIVVVIMALAPTGEVETLGGPVSVVTESAAPVEPARRPDRTAVAETPRATPAPLPVAPKAAAAPIEATPEPPEPAAPPPVADPAPARPEPPPLDPEIEDELNEIGDDVPALKAAALRANASAERARTVALLERAAELSPDDLEIRQRLCGALKVERRYVEAQTQCRAWLRLETNPRYRGVIEVHLEQLAERAREQAATRD